MNSEELSELINEDLRIDYSLLENEWEKQPVNLLALLLFPNCY
jgi:hypothetical protein